MRGSVAPKDTLSTNFRRVSHRDQVAATPRSRFSKTFTLTPISPSPMPPQIRVTTSLSTHLIAAASLSQCLYALNCAHAFIGGFAWSVLGSNRSTEDIDVLIDPGQEMDMQAVRQRLTEVNEQIVVVGLKLYFIHKAEGSSDVKNSNASSHNVCIETLPTGALGLPEAAEPLYMVRSPSGVDIPLFHPSVLILTKFKRWYTTLSSTPQNRAQTPVRRGGH